MSVKNHFLLEFHPACTHTVSYFFNIRCLFVTVANTGARTTFDANLAVGYYMTPHDFTPFGDMVWYVSTNVSQPIDNRAKNSGTFVSLTPGFRTHVGQNWYLLGAVEVPVTNPQPFGYQVLGGIMKVF